jgi:hypothetical protein
VSQRHSTTFALSFPRLAGLWDPSTAAPDVAHSPRKNNNDSSFTAKASSDELEQVLPR